MSDHEPIEAQDDTEDIEGHMPRFQDRKPPTHAEDAEQPEAEVGQDRPGKDPGRPKLRF